MKTTSELIDSVKNGFKTLKVDQKYKDLAITHIEKWLSSTEFSEYQPQLIHMINSESWDYLLDCFYQVIPFGTGGRRGEVGIGPNRINPWTIMSSAQGHSQFLIKQYGEDAKSRGVVLAFDVRQFFTNKFFNDELPNPVKNLDCKDLAIAATQVYTANDIKIYIFDAPRTTPELSFAIRHLKCVGGDMFSASHNPPEHNGKKVYDEFGGQLIPPDDEALVTEVTQNVQEIKTLDYEQAKNNGLIEIIGDEIDDAYIQAVANLSLSKSRNLDIVYTPLHGCGGTSVIKILQKVGFKVQSDPNTTNQSGKFENVTFNIPNPEVIQSFDSPLKFAKEQDADIILNSDPDADRIGVMVKNQGEWSFLNGNEIAAILTEFVISKRKQEVGENGVIVKTAVTTNLLTQIAQHHNMKIVGDLLVGFKYIGAIMNEMDQRGEIDNLLIACEESHGYIAGNYVRDKDAAIAGLWLAECAAELKEVNQTLVDYLENIYSKYGYFKNYLTEIRLPGAEGMSQIESIQKFFRDTQPKKFGEFEVESFEDWLDRTPIVSQTDKSSKNGLVFTFKPVIGTTTMKITVRPSGTEPKIKMYFEIGSLPFDKKEMKTVVNKMQTLLEEFEKAFMMESYKSIGVDFPERGFLLFWQLPLTAKLKYFEIEDQIAALKNENQEKRKEMLDNLLSFLGSDPIQKVDNAFIKKYGESINTYLEF
jgi:phosphoglucomutase